MSALLFDLRYALRGLRRTPGFAIVVLLTLALGIGANSAIFSVVNTVLLKPLPYADPERLVTVFHNYPKLELEAPVTAPGFKAYRDRTRSFDGFAVQTGWAANLTGSGDPERLTATRVTQQFFQTLGVAPRLGRGFVPSEEEPGNDKVVVLSHGLWQRLFAGDERAVGKRLLLNGESYQVVGVMPQSFLDPWNRQTELWAPIAFTPAQLASQNEYLMVTARLKPTVTLAQAQADLTALSKSLQEEAGEEAGYGLLAKPVTKQLVGNIRSSLFVLLGAVGFVLLIACANVANLFLVRASGRYKEIALRTTLGAQRWPLVRQLLVESVTLSALGGVLGLALAWGMVRLLVAFNPGNIPRLDELRVDGWVVVFTGVISIATGVLFGIFPALRTTSANLHETLKESGGRSGTADRVGQFVRRSLVVSEVALALTLLVGGGLLLRSFARLSSVDPGFNGRNLLTFGIGLPPTKYASDTARRAFFAEAVTRLAALPGVQGAAVATVLPFSGSWSTGSFNVEGYQLPPDGTSPWGDQRVVSAGYFETMGAPLVAGRYLDATDRLDGVRVAVVDDEFVKRFYKKGESAIGKRFWFGNSTPTDSTRYITIVGVVGHARHEGLDAEPRVQVYRPFAQAGGGGGASVVVRTTGEPLQMVASVRAAIHEIDRELPLANIHTMEEMIGTSMSQRKLSTVLLGVFSAIALLLATIGIYGVMSYTVSQRQRELGIRMALGASRDGVLRMVLQQGMTLAIIGVGVGLFGAFALTRLITSQLYDVGATDPMTFVVVTTVLTSVALVASLVPAMRATRVDPMVALREE